MGDSIYNPFSIANNASQYYEFNHNRYEYIKHLHGRVLDKHSYNQQLMTPFGSTYIYATISDDTLSLYNRIADEGERNIQKRYLIIMLEKPFISQKNSYQMNYLLV